MLRNLLKTVFGGSDHEDDPQTTIKINRVSDDDSHVSVHRYTDRGNDKHTHDEYKINKASGEYKEYRGGENSDDRSYNKKPKKRR